MQDGPKPAEHYDGPLRPGEWDGLPGLLRAWRARAGRQLGLGRALSQQEVADAVGRSRSWYRSLERGARLKADRPLVDALAEVLLLDPHECAALLFAALEAAPPTIPAHLASEEVRRTFQARLDHQLPDPAYLTDADWNIVGYNAAMTALWPWVRESSANLMRWALLSREARIQFADWSGHAVEYIKMLRFADASRPPRPGIGQLIRDVLADPACARLWARTQSVSANRDGHCYRMTLPALDNQPIDVMSTVMHPASMPGWRATVLPWTYALDPIPAPREQAETVIKVPSTSPTSPAGSGYFPPTAHDATRHAGVADPGKAAALAGDQGVPMPMLSTLFGTGTDHALTYKPDSRTVIWATRRAEGHWDVAELSAYAVVGRLPRNATTETAHHELMLLTRAQLPADPKQALKACDARMRWHQAQAEFLQRLRRQVQEEEATT